MVEDVDELQYSSVRLYAPPRRPDRRDICSSPRFRVAVHHPAYESTRLFEISAFDGESGGIHHGTLLLLCGIIAGGIWSGWLSEEKGGRRLIADAEAVLTKPDYYYHIPHPTGDLRTSSTPYKWPVVLSLEDLTFPHGRPPPGWTFDDPEMTSSFFSGASVSSMSQAVRDRDMTCRVTGYTDGIERAHLCPRSAAQWFNREEMERYNIRANLSGSTSVDDMANAVALRQEVHSELDKGTFAFVRKHGKWVPHFFNPTHDLGPEYHNVPVEMPAAVSEAFIFTNIAIAILPRISNFLIRGEKRKVIVKKGSDAAQITEMSGEDIRAMLDQSKRPRSNSPRKRLRNPDPDDGPGDASDAKRLCPNWPVQRSPDILATPSLDVSKSSSNSENSALQRFDSDFKYAEIKKLRQEALKKQRRLNASMACCDYDTAEASIKDNGHGRPGDTQLCFQCLGAELVREDPES